MRIPVLIGVLVILSVSPEAQQTVVTCPAGQVPQASIAGQSATVVCVAAPVVTPPPPTAPAPVMTGLTADPSLADPGQTVTFRATVTGGQAPLGFVMSLNGTPVAFTPVTASSATVVAPTTAGQHVYLVTVADALKRTSFRHVTVTVKASAPPPAEPPPPPVPVACVGTWGPWAPVGGFSACALDVSGQWRQSRTESRTFAVTTPAANGGTACPASPESRVFVQSCPDPTPPPPPIPPPSSAIWGVVDPSILGDFSPAEHDAHVVDGGDGFKYRTWHPQCVGTRCYAHEHGDNPASATQPDIVASLKTAPLGFGYIGRRMPMPNEPNGHEEPHEGFKVFSARRGQVNDEQRTNLTDSLSVFHMGTGGPRRGSTRDHSNDLRVYNPDTGFIHTRLMMDTGGVNNVCDPRGAEPSKDMFTIPNRCKVNSGYEIWTTFRWITRASGALVYRARAVPAVFDPITVFVLSNPAELVYAWDDRFKPYRNFPNDDWRGNRGCIRENYAQVGESRNAGGLPVIWTNTLGQEISPLDPLAIRQVVPTKSIVDHRSSTARPGEAAGNQAFKLKVDYCGGAAAKAKLGLKN